MSLETAIKARLDAVAGLKQYVSNRNYAVRLPDDYTLPATTFQVLSERPVLAMGSDPDLTEARVRVSAWANDFSTCRLVDEQIKAALNRFRGTSGSTVVNDILRETTVDIYHPEVGGGRYQRARDFRVFYEAD